MPRRRKRKGVSNDPIDCKRETKDVSVSGVHADCEKIHQNDAPTKFIPEKLRGKKYLSKFLKDVYRAYDIAYGYQPDLWDHTHPHEPDDSERNEQMERCQMPDAQSTYPDGFDNVPESDQEQIGENHSQDNPKRSSTYPDGFDNVPESDQEQIGKKHIQDDPGKKSTDPDGFDNVPESDQEQIGKKHIQEDPGKESTDPGGSEFVPEREQEQKKINHIQDDSGKESTDPDGSEFVPERDQEQKKINHIQDDSGKESTDPDGSEFVPEREQEQKKINHIQDDSGKESTDPDGSEFVPERDQEQKKINHIQDDSGKESTDPDGSEFVPEREQEQKKINHIQDDSGKESTDRDGSEFVPEREQEQKKINHIQDDSGKESTDPDGSEFVPERDQEQKKINHIQDDSGKESTDRDGSEFVPERDQEQNKINHIQDDSGKESTDPDGSDFVPESDQEQKKINHIQDDSGKESTDPDGIDFVPESDQEQMEINYIQDNSGKESTDPDGSDFVPESDQEQMEINHIQDYPEEFTDSDDSDFIPEKDQEQMEVSHIQDYPEEESTDSDGIDFVPESDQEQMEVSHIQDYPEEESTDSDDSDFVQKSDQEQMEISHIQDYPEEFTDSDDSDFVPEKDQERKKISHIQDYPEDSTDSDDSDIVPESDKEQMKMNHIQDDPEKESPDPVDSDNVPESDNDLIETNHIQDDPEKVSEMPEQYRLKDITNPEIFTKSYEKNKNENSKSGRTYDRRHCCLFCGEMRTNIQSHYAHAHKNLKEVRELHELKIKIAETFGEEKKQYKAKLLQQQTLLRNKGNDIHNRKVCANKKGEIILGRRKNSSVFDCSKYGPCPYCREWVLYKLMTQHKNTCSAISEEDVFSKSATVIQSKILKGQIKSKPSKLMAKEVFPSMKSDNVTELAQNDELIVALGELWLLKNFGNRLRRKNFTSFRMRLCARLLLLLRQTSGTEYSMKSFIDPAYFDMAVTCAIKACALDEHEELLNPSVAIKIGYDVARLASAKLGFCIKQSDEKGKCEASDFLKLVQMEWALKVNRRARILLEERNFNKQKSLPIPDDIVNLAGYLVKQLRTIDLSPEKFREVVVLTESRLLLYNRRRPGELESISVDAYKKRSTSIDETEMALRENLTKVEKALLERQDLIEIRGKTGRGVPLLVPAEARKMLEFLSCPEIRKKAGVSAENNFLFANKASSVVRAGTALNEVKTRLALKDPSRILATNLRKHTATIAQVMSLNEQEMKNLCRHLGHTQKVHDQFYRQTSGLIERIDIAKLMLIQEYNLTSKYASKRMDEIQLDEIFEDIVSDDLDQDADKVVHTSVPDVLTVDGEDATSLFAEPAEWRRKSNTNTRVRWDAAEEKELKKYLPQYFKKAPLRTCPTQAECKLAIERSAAAKGKLCKRGWETIKKKVNNMLKR